MRSRAFVFILLAVTVFACGQKDQQSFDGLWVERTNLNILKYDDGKVSHYSKLEKRFVNESDFRIERNRIVVRIFNQEVSREFKLDGNKMTVLRNPSEQNIYELITEDEFNRLTSAPAR